MEEKKLHTKWKIIPLPIAKEPEHFFFVQQEKYNYHKFYLKKDVELFLGMKIGRNCSRTIDCSRKERPRTTDFLTLTLAAAGLRKAVFKNPTDSKHITPGDEIQMSKATLARECNVKKQQSESTEHETNKKRQRNN